MHVRIITAGTPGLLIMIAGADHVQILGSWCRLLSKKTQECYACIAVYADYDVFDADKMLQPLHYASDGLCVALMYPKYTLQ